MTKTTTTVAADGETSTKTRRKPSAPKVSRAKAPVLADVPFLDPAERHHKIEQAAYFLAEQRGFAPGHEESDWAAAVRLVDGV